MTTNPESFSDTRKLPFVWLTREIATQIWPKLGDKAARIYISLCSLQDGMHSDRGCWPGLSYLAKQNNCSTDTVRRAIDELVAANLVRVEERFSDSGSQQSNRYILIDPESPLAHVPPPPRMDATPPLAPMPPDQYIYDQESKINPVAQSAQSSTVLALPAQTMPLLNVESTTTRTGKKSSVDAQKAPKRQVYKSDEQSDYGMRFKAMMDAYAEACGYTGINFGREGKHLKGIVEAGYSTEDFIACYRHFKSQPFWASQHLSIQYLEKNIGAFVKNRNTPSKPAVVDSQNGILANGWQDLRHSDHERMYSEKNKVLTTKSADDILREAMAIFTGEDTDVDFD